MPARKKHMYTVSVDYPGQERAEVLYLGTSEKQALWCWYRNVRDAKPGSVLLLKEDGQIVLRFVVPG